MNNVEIVYFSKYYNIQNFVDFYLQGEQVHKVENNGECTLPEGSNCILILPTYEMDYIQPVLDFLEKNHGKVLGIVGSGDRNYHELYLFTAFELSEKYGIPVFGGFENLGSPLDGEAVKNLVKSLKTGEVYDFSHFDPIHEDRDNYFKNR